MFVNNNTYRILNLYQKSKTPEVGQYRLNQYRYDFWPKISRISISVKGKWWHK